MPGTTKRWCGTHSLRRRSSIRRRTWSTRASDRLAEGFVAAGRIAWHGDPTMEESVSRWVSVVFLQGDEADRALRILNESGPADAVDYLIQ